MELTQYHPSRFSQNHYVYPVVSRRAKGVSVGINLTPNGQCNFHCVYCQVERDRQRNSTTEEIVEPPTIPIIPIIPTIPLIPTDTELSELSVDLSRLETELCDVVTAVQTGRLFEDSWFAATPPDKRELRDIAFAGDGEPTLSPVFAEAVAIAVKVRQNLCQAATKLVLITNGSRLIPGPVFDQLLAANGEFWVKLDGGTEEDVKRINRTAIPFATLFSKLQTFAVRYPVVIQTCLFAGSAMNFTEYLHRLQDLATTGAKVQRVQLYTVARQTAEATALPLDSTAMDRFAEQVRRHTPFDVESYYSS